MPNTRILTGDVTGRLAELPDESVHCVVTSPPYWGLRDYGTGAWEGGDAGCEHVQSDLATGTHGDGTTQPARGSIIHRTQPGVCRTRAQALRAGIAAV